MALNQSFPNLDGICPSWADISVVGSATGVPLIEMKDIKSISTGTSMDIGEMRGASGGKVIKRTTGASKSEASMTLYYSGFTKFLRALKGQAPLRGGKIRAMSLVFFGLNIQFTPPGSTEIFETRIKGCRFTGRTSAPSEGSDAHTVDVNLNTIEVVDVIDGEECALL